MGNSRQRVIQFPTGLVPVASKRITRGLSCSVIFDPLAACLVTCETPRSAEDSEASIGILVHASARLDVMMAVAVGRDLQVAALVAHGVVAGDDTLLVDAEGRHRKERRSVWQESLLARRPTNVVLVAMANKTARVVWAMLSRGEAFQAEARSAA